MSSSSSSFVPQVKTDRSAVDLIVSFFFSWRMGFLVRVRPLTAPVDVVNAVTGPPVAMDPGVVMYIITGNRLETSLAAGVRRGGPESRFLFLSGLMRLVSPHAAAVVSSPGLEWGDDRALLLGPRCVRGPGQRRVGSQGSGGNRNKKLAQFCLRC